MDINHLSIKELEILGDAIKDRIKTIKNQQEDEIKRKNSVKNKTKLSQLTSSDRIFKINIYKNANNGETVIETNYVNVYGVGKDKEERGYNYNFGGSSSWFDNETGEKHFHLDDFMSISFFTLKPKSWYKDFLEAKEYRLKIKKESLDRELLNLENKLYIFDELKDDIDYKVKK